MFIGHISNRVEVELNYINRNYGPVEIRNDTWEMFGFIYGFMNVDDRLDYHNSFSSIIKKIRIAPWNVEERILSMIHSSNTYYFRFEKLFYVKTCTIHEGEARRLGYMKE